MANIKKQISIYNMEYHQVGKISTHYIMRVPGGWIYTDRRSNKALSGVFVPWRNKDYIENCGSGDRKYIDVNIDLLE